MERMCLVTCCCVDVVAKVEVVVVVESSTEILALIFEMKKQKSK